MTSLTQADGTSRAVVEVGNLWHRYSADWALKGVNLLIEGKGVVGLLGSNGAGKSTFMNIICGCLSQAEGVVRIAGIDVRRTPLEARRQIGFLPQQAPLSFELTTDEYLLFCAGLRGLSSSEAKKAVGFVVERCGLGDMRHRLIGNLSGGYRQRVGIAQALVHRPPLVVLDEPTVGLDPNQILDIRRLIEEIGRDHTVIFSTHILPEVEVMCRDVFMIERGRIVFHGDINDFRSLSESRSLILVSPSRLNTADLKSAVSSIEHVEALNSTTLRIRYSGGREIAPALVAFSQEQGWPIEEIYFERASLEDVFATLVEDGAR